MRLEREARDLAAAFQSSRQLGQPLSEGGHSSGSNVEDMRNWLKTLGEVAHQPCPPWCACCVMAKSRAKPHSQRHVESVKVPEFEVDFCYRLQAETSAY